MGQEGRGRIAGESVYNSLARGLLRRVQGAAVHKYMVEKGLTVNGVPDEVATGIREGIRQLLIESAGPIKGWREFPILSPLAVSLLASLTEDQLQRIEGIGPVKGEIISRALSRRASNRLVLPPPDLTLE